MIKKIFLSVIAFPAVIIFGIFAYFYIDFSSGKRSADKYFENAKVKKNSKYGQHKDARDFAPDGLVCR